jgi:hypothetical protein
MNRLRWSLLGLIGLGMGCGSEPGYEPVYSGSSTRSTSASDERPDLPRAHTTPSVEAPRRTIAAMQVCADRFAGTRFFSVEEHAWKRRVVGDGRINGEC